MLNPAELGFQMSLKSGVPVLDKDRDFKDAFSELKFQADVNSTTTSGKLLVDDSEHRRNASLWVEILRFRQRIDGFWGTLDVWQGMRKRNVDLPVSGPEADMLWTTFIHAAIATAREHHDDSRKLLSEVFEYAQDLKARSDLQFDGLYKCIVGRLLRLRRSEAREWHHCLCHALPGAIGTVAIDAMLSTNPNWAFRQWSQIYRASRVRYLYDYCIRESIGLEDEAAALRWHRLFVQNGDGPTAEMFATPAVQRLFALDNDSSLPMKTSPGNRQSKWHVENEELKVKIPALTRQSMNTIVGDVHGIKPKEISDSFCARLFATRAFSIDLVIRGLSFLGIESLGPLAIREMAMRAGSPVEFSNQLENLKEHGLRFGDTVFARLVVKLANEGQSTLWSALHESDQHPEVYEDSATQEALLTSFLEQQKWKQAHIALTALSFSASRADLRAWNRVLQHYILHREYRSVLSTMQSIQNQGLTLTLYSLTLLRRYILPERRRTKRPIKGQGPKFFDPLDFVRNACVHTAENGHFVPANLWSELLKRYGMAHRWGETERLVLWLFDHYSPNNQRDRKASNTRNCTGRMRSVRALRSVFSEAMLQALFTWGFRSQSVRKNLRLSESSPVPGGHEPWAQGLALLKIVQQRSLFNVTLSARKAFQQRMWTLFGAGVSTLGVNNEARLVNQISLAHYIRHANEVWNGLVHWVDPALLEETHQSNSRLLIEFFGPVHSTNRKRSEYADVEAWAKALGQMKSSHYYQAASISARKRAWQRSSIRLVGPVQRVHKGLLSSPEVTNRTEISNERHQDSDSIGQLNKASRHLLPEHQPPSAHLESWHPRPSLQYTPAHP